MIWYGISGAAVHAAIRVMFGEWKGIKREGICDGLKGFGVFVFV